MNQVVVNSLTLWRDRSVLSDSSKHVTFNAKLKAASK